MHHSLLESDLSFSRGIFFALMRLPGPTFMQESSNLKHLKLTLAVLLATHGWFLFRLGSWLWSREHYQFFPLVIIASVIMAYVRWPECSWKEPRTLSIRIAILSSLSTLLLLTAVLKNSQLLGALSFLTSLWTAVWFFGGKKREKSNRSWKSWESEKERKFFEGKKLLTLMILAFGGLFASRAHTKMDR